jgi:hypothetical protein
MYLDGGEELLPGSALDNYASLEALQVGKAPSWRLPGMHRHACCWQSSASADGGRLTCLHMHMQVDGAGNLTMRFTGPPGASAGATCSAGVQWPQLDGLLLLGAGAVDPATLTVQVRGRGAAGLLHAH